MTTFRITGIQLFLCLLGGLLAASPVAASTTYNVPRVSGSVTCDAVLDEPAWGSAISIDANYEVRPGENIPAPVKTEVLIAHNDTHVFVAFKAFDPDPSQIRAHIVDRDRIWSDDWVLILFDTFNDNRRSYDFFCNPYGIQGDEIEAAEGGGGSWDAIWDSSGRITDIGYIVEMSIPFSCLNIQPGEGEQVWGFDAVRSYPRNVRHHIGAFPRDRNNNNYLSQAHKLKGFAHVKGGRNIEIAPTFSTGVAHERESLDNGSWGPMKQTGEHYDPGVTAQWGVTPNVKLSFTANPDFSQVEADAAQMDINNRFPLYYSEKRPFFIENADIYSVPGTNLVHTRTLADPEWGVRTTGKYGKHSFGFFSVRDAYTPLIFSGPEGADNTTLSLQSTGSVLRYRRDVGTSSYIGLIMTDREGTDYFNRVGGIDTKLRFTPQNCFQLRINGSMTQYPGEVADEYEQHRDGLEGSMVDVGYTFENERYGYEAVYSRKDRDFRADLGFVTQTGTIWQEVRGWYKWRGDADNWYTWLSLWTSYDIFQQTGGELMQRDFNNVLNYNGPHESWFGWDINIGKSRYNNKKFRRNFIELWGGFKPTGTTELGFSGMIGDRIDYDNTRKGSVLSFRPNIVKSIGKHLSLSGAHEIQKLDVDRGRLYTANVSNGTITFNFSRRMFVRSTLQYADYRRNVHLYEDDVDPKTRRVFKNFLFSYKINAQTVFYLGYSEDYNNKSYRDEHGVLDESLIRTNRAVFTKIGYALAL